MSLFDYIMFILLSIAVMIAGIWISQAEKIIRDLEKRLSSTEKKLGIEDSKKK